MTDENTCLTCDNWAGDSCNMLARYCLVDMCCHFYEDYCDEWEALE